MGNRPVTCTATLAGEKSEYYFILPVDIQAAFGRHGDRVRIRLELDDQRQVVKPPLELSGSFARAADARAIYDQLSYSHQKAYADWVAEAKRPETRARRAEASVERLLAGRKEPSG